MNVRAIGNQAADQPLKPIDIVRRPVGPNDVDIDIAFCGICHSDIHTARSEWGPALYPCVPGHEIVGRVKAKGSKVTKHAVGDWVGVGCFVDSCRTCGECVEGNEQFCENGATFTYNTPVDNIEGHTKGGYATRIVTDQDYVLRLPENLDPAGAAPLLCAGITTYSPLRQVGLQPGQKLAVLGLGGLGHMAVKIGAAMGAEVTVLSRSPSKQADAENLGAKKFVLTTRSDDMAALTLKYDVIVDTVSAKHDIAQIMSLLKRDGRYIIVGIPEVPLDLPVFPLIMPRRHIMGSLIGGICETQEMLDFCADHDITADIEMIKPHQINEAYDRTLKSDVKYRFVMDCSAIE